MRLLIPCRRWSEDVMSADSIGSVSDRSGPRDLEHELRWSGRLSYEERCVDPAEPEPQTPGVRDLHKAHVRDVNGKASEAASFIPGSADAPSAAQTCNPCSSPRSCRTIMCTVLTCGLYRFCKLTPCMGPNERAPDKAEKVSLRAANLEDSKEEDWLGDVCIAGVKVDSPREYLNFDPKAPLHVPPPSGQTQPSHLSLQESLRFDDWEDVEEDVDSLITKKLLELYSEYQIEELARCTTDSVFLRKSKAINQLINSLAEEHKMDEQEAECRLVRGIIRISTRKSTKKRPRVSRVERTLSDSGNETMRDSQSFSSSNNSKFSRSFPLQKPRSTILSAPGLIATFSSISR